MLYCLLKSLLLEEITEGISYCQNRFLLIFLTYTMRTDPWAFFISVLSVTATLVAGAHWEHVTSGWPYSGAQTVRAFLPPLLSLGCIFSPFRPQSWESHVLLRISWWKERWLNPMKASIQGSPTLLLLKTCVSNLFSQTETNPKRVFILCTKARCKNSTRYFASSLYRGRTEGAHRAPSPGTALGISAVSPFTCV